MRRPGAFALSQDRDFTNKIALLAFNCSFLALVGFQGLPHTLPFARQLDTNSREVSLCFWVCVTDSRPSMAAKYDQLTASVRVSST